MTGHDYIAKPVQSETAVPSFFSRVLNRARAHSNVEGNDESVLSHVDWTVVDAFHPDDSGNTPLHILLKVTDLPFDFDIKCHNCCALRLQVCTESLALSLERGPQQMTMKQ